MQKVNLPIVFHFHQPVDNFDHVIENIYEKLNDLAIYDEDIILPYKWHESGKP